LYLHAPDLADEPDANARLVRESLAESGFASRVRRATVALSPGQGRAVGYYTLRPDAAGTYAEDDLVRGMHPMVGRRLNLWRLSEFDVTRIEAPEDVLLYEC